MAAAPSAPASVHPGTGAATQAPTSDSAIVGDRHTVTLITGDKVVVGKNAQGRPDAEVVSQVRGTDSIAIFSNSQGVFAIPNQVLPYLGSGQLDRRLFDVSLLAEDGYDDEHSAAVPLIATYPQRQGLAPMAARPVPEHSKAVAQLPSVSGVALSTAKTEAGAFWQQLTGAGATADTTSGTTSGATSGQSPVTPKAATAAGANASVAAGLSAAAQNPPLSGGIAKLWLDGKAKAALDVSVPSIGAPQAWAEGYDGTGVKIAVLDTGIDDKHPDFAGRIAAEQNFSSSPDTLDRYGHGTHVASIAAGSGAADNGKYVGVAPKSQLLIGKVIGDDGTGSDSQIIAGMQWAVAQGAKVVNMSLGASGDYNDPADPLTLAVDSLSASSGTLFVIAAGNDGRGDGYKSEYIVTTPGNAHSALTVGATNAGDSAMAYFSSRGPRADDYSIKPEISAPGVDITAARAAGTTLGDTVDQYYQTLSGTSMATPHVAGAAALLAQRHPDWTGQQLKAALVDYAATDTTETIFDQGGGRLRVPEALDAAVTTDVGAVSLGYAAWPRTAGQTLTKTVTYTNTGDQPVTYRLTASAGRFDDLISATHKGDGSAGPVSVSPATLTVPAHGSAAATITAAVGSSATGVFAGYLTATPDAATGASTPAAPAAAPAFNLPLTYTAEPEKYRLDVQLYDAYGGRPTSLNAAIWALNLDTGQVWAGLPIDGAVSWPGWIGPSQLVRFPAGNYAVLTTGILSDVPGSPSKSTLTVGAIPQIKLDHDVSVTFDARQAKPVAPRVPQAGATVSAATAWLDRETPTASFHAEVGYTYDGDQLRKLTAIPSGTATQGTFAYAQKSALAAPTLTVTPEGKDRGHGSAVPVGVSQFSDAHYEGDYRGPLIDVGRADPADLAGKDLAGKIVVLHPTPVDAAGHQPPGTQLSARLLTLAKAGVKLVLIPDVTSYQWLIDVHYDPTLPPTAFVDEPDLARITGGPVHIVGTTDSPWAYFTSAADSRIPASAGSLRPDEFAQVDARYHTAPSQADLTYECWYPHRETAAWPYNFGGSLPVCAGTHFLRSAPSSCRRPARSTGPPTRTPRPGSRRGAPRTRCGTSACCVRVNVWCPHRSPVRSPRARRPCRSRRTRPGRCIRPSATGAR
ncbi:S8 family serine peptidase [Catenulispora yoronensis]